MSRTPLPTNGTLLKLAERFVTDQALADHLGVARTTIRDHINRQGAREAVKALRGAENVPHEQTEIPVIRRDYSHLDKLLIYPLGDVHKGATHHRADRWQEWLDYLVKHEDTSLLGTGDFLNSAIVGSKSEVYDERMTVGDAKRELRRELQPLADQGRIDVMVPGNHEDRIYRAVGDCPVRDLCDSLDVPYVEASALLIYTVGDFEYEVYMRHGTGNGQSMAGLAKSGEVIRADVYVTGHTHRQAVHLGDIFERKGERVGRHKRYFVSSGSFVGYEKYAAVRGYPPSHLGGPRIRLDGRVWDSHVSI